MRLFSLGAWLSKQGALEIRSERCVRAFSQLANCRLCENICPEEALHWQSDGWVERGCTQCGKCVAACPQQVFSLNERAVSAAAESKKKLIIGCVRDPSSHKRDLSIECFQQLTPEFILSILAQVEHLTLAVDQNACRNCVHQWVPQMLLVLLERLPIQYQGQLDIIDEPHALAALAPDREDIQSRRAFLKDTVAHLKQSGAETALSYMEERQSAFVKNTDADLPPARRSILMTLLKGTEDPGQLLPYQGLVATDCIYCEACVRLCPQGALRLAKEDEAQLTYAAALCSGCGLCVDICRIKGLHLSRALTVEEFMTPTWTTLISAEKRQCDICEEVFFHKSQTICSFCAAKKERDGL